MIKITDIKPNPNNPRKISSEALEKLKDSISRDPEFMALRPIVIDENGMILGGNQRLKAIIELGMTDIPDTWVVSADNLSEEQRERFILVDNSPEGMSGKWDIEILKTKWELPELDLVGLGELIFEEGEPDEHEEQDTPYTDKIGSLMYEPKNKKPEIHELFDNKKTIELISDITKSLLDDDIKAFLIHAAQRHTIFNYSKIADFYAHATQEIKELMEKSALIIIDYNKALEEGYIILTESIKQIYKEDYDD
jgi:hypothetical protein